MKTNTTHSKGKLAAVVGMIVLAAMMLTACGLDSAKEKAVADSAKVSAYMQEDQAAVKKLNKEYKTDVNKAKDEKAVTKLQKQYKKDIKSFATRDEQIKSFKKLTNEAIKDMKSKKDQKAATKILKSYDKKLDAVKTKADFLTLTDKINADIKAKTGEDTGVVAATVESATTTVTKKAAAAASSTGSKSYSSGLKSSSTVSSGGSHSSGSSSSGSSSSGSTHQKQKVWVVDQAAWTETKYTTETVQQAYEVPCWKFNDGSVFYSYHEAYVYYSDENEYHGGFCQSSETRYRSVQVQKPYTVNHPEQGHYEYQ